MAKVLQREVTITDDRDQDHVEALTRGDPGVEPLPRLTLHPGDAVPSWAVEYMDESWYEEGVNAAGTNLYDDNVYQVVKAVADEKGVEYGEGWDAAQIASAVRYDEQQSAVVESLGDAFDDETESAYSDGKQAMAALFDDTNKSGNVNAPDQAAAKPTRGSRSSGGADSSTT